MVESTPGVSPSHSSTEPPDSPQPCPPDLPRSVGRGICTAVAVFLMLFSAYFGAIFIMSPFLPLTILRPKLFRRCIDSALVSWLMFTEFLMVRLMGIRVRHFGDPFDSDCTKQHASLLLLNHRTQLDWFFSWGLGFPVQRMKIILKDSLSNFPGAGWAMQCGSFVFLRRQIDTDKERIRRVLTYLWNVGSNCELLLFPEGTDLNRASLARSHEFARKAGLSYTAYTMHPRATGFVYLATFFGPSRLDYIYDVTVAYPDQLPSPEVNVFWGQVPTEVHYHVQRIPATDLPWQSDAPDEQQEQLAERLTTWLRSRWSAKEQLLHRYYSNPIGQRAFDNEIPVRSHVFRDPSMTGSLDLTLRGLGNSLFWFGSLVFLLYALYTWSTVRYFAIVVQLVFLYLGYFAGGVTRWGSQFVAQDPPLISG